METSVSNNKMRKYSIYVDVEIDVFDQHNPETEALKELQDLLSKLGSRMVFTGRMKIAEGTITFKKPIEDSSPELETVKNVVEDEFKKFFEKQDSIKSFYRGVSVEWEK